jgi:hypothetical protein
MSFNRWATIRASSLPSIAQGPASKKKGALGSGGKKGSDIDLEKLKYLELKTNYKFRNKYPLKKIKSFCCFH